MKILTLFALTAVLLAASGCGSSSTLDDSQFKDLRAQGKQFAKSMQGVGADAASCASTANSGANSSSPVPPDLNIVKTCLGNALSKAQDNLTKIVAFTDDLSTEVDGACSTDLKALGAAKNDVKGTFAKAEAQAQKADLIAMQATLKSLDSNKITSAGVAAEKACR